MDDKTWGSVKRCIQKYKTVRGMDKHFSKTLEKLHYISGGGKESERGRSQDWRSKDKDKWDKKTRICFNCNKEADHYASSCRDNKSGRFRNGSMDSKKGSKSTDPGQGGQTPYDRSCHNRNGIKQGEEQ